MITTEIEKKSVATEVSGEETPVKVTYFTRVGYTKTLEFMKDMAQDNPDRWVTCADYSLLFDAVTQMYFYSYITSGIRVDTTQTNFFMMFAAFTINFDLNG